MNRVWMDLAVAVVLVGILIAGGTMIWRLNQDAMEVEMQDELADMGQEVSRTEGCIACHTVDGSPGVGPSWLGMYGNVQTLRDGTTVVVDEDYFIESVREPAAKLVEGFPNVMPGYYALGEEKLDALLAFARQLSDPS